MKSMILLCALAAVPAAAQESWFPAQDVRDLKADIRQNVTELRKAGQDPAKKAAASDVPRWVYLGYVANAYACADLARKFYYPTFRFTGTGYLPGECYGGWGEQVLRVQESAKADSPTVPVTAASGTWIYLGWTANVYECADMARRNGYPSFDFRGGSYTPGECYGGWNY